MISLRKKPIIQVHQRISLRAISEVRLKTVNAYITNLSTFQNYIFNKTNQYIISFRTGQRLNKDTQSTRSVNYNIFLQADQNYYHKTRHIVFTNKHLMERKIIILF